MIELFVPLMQVLPDQVPTTVVGIVGALALSIMTIVSLVVRASLKQMGETQMTELEFRRQAAKDNTDHSRAMQTALMQIVGFMASLNEQMRSIQGELMKAALREPVEVRIRQSKRDPIPVEPIEPEAKS